MRTLHLFQTCFVKKYKLEECKEALELKHKAMSKAREKEKAVTKAFQASLGDDKNYEEYVTKVFKRKMKRVKKTEEPSEGEWRRVRGK